ncbi:hypothetical protein LCGC14_0221370 [marine sediment metagenome]|uniref:Serine protease n=1 Tax=marine sediment metagenome TaxID=412755 RepID=A0A0F9UI12_9ZZZZ
MLCLLSAGTDCIISEEKSNVVSPVIDKPVIDKIELKQKEMRDTIVLVKTRRGSGSGTIIDRIDIDIENIFEYRILTNAHVVHSRFFRYLRGVNSLTGKIKTEVVDTGCEIITFDHKNQKWNSYVVDIVSEDVALDLAILSFVSNKELNVAKIANDDMLKQIRVFDEVFAIGCQLGQAPSPTTGIVSRILTGTHNKQKWIVYGSTTQIVPGSSGGGLFKEYDDHYYLIGIPYLAAITNSGQFVSHLSSAISVVTAKNFIDENSVCND